MAGYSHDRSVARCRQAISVAALCAALALGSCQTARDSRGTLFGGGGSPEITGSIGPSRDSLVATGKLAAAWEKNPADPRAAMMYVSQLEAIGSNGKALQVLQETWRRNSDNAALASAYGKRLAAAGRPAEARTVLERALALGAGRDWRVHSLLGTVHDALGEHKLAQADYAEALRLKPNHTPVLNNMGMSHALAGDLKTAEKILRRALGIDGKNSTVRQNLALVVGLQGRFSEAERIVSRDLPPNLVAANIAYLRTMLSQNNVWDALKAGKGKTGEKGRS